MDNEIKTWLYDILQSIIEIDSFYTDKTRKFEEYIKDIRTKRTVEGFDIIKEIRNFAVSMI